MSPTVRHRRRAGAAPDSRSLVEITDVRREYPGGTVALAGVTLSIRRGEAVAILGPSGCGKSTVLNMIAGLDRPTSGRVTVEGLRVDTMSETRSAIYRRRTVGMVFQFFHLLDDLTAIDNVDLPAGLVGTAPAAARERARALLTRMGIADRADTFPGRLSGGEQQRVAVARALINEPTLLLADEPTGALDSAAGREVADLLREINRFGQTLVVVTHDRTFAQYVATRTIDLIDGRIVADSAATGHIPVAP